MLPTAEVFLLIILEGLIPVVVFEQLFEEELLTEEFIELELLYFSLSF